jgi:hypothetical protein
MKMNVICVHVVSPGVSVLERRTVCTFMPYCSLAINGLCWMNSNVFLRQVKGRGNTRSRKIDISSTRSANTYHCKRISSRTFEFTRTRSPNDGVAARADGHDVGQVELTRE